MQRQSLVQHLSPSRDLIRDAALILLAAGATALAAKVQIPLQPVPITLQTLVVLVSGAALGARLGALSQIAYLLAGVLGAPVFSAPIGGPAILAGPTGGYLLAFVPAAALVGWLAEKGWDRSLAASALMLFLGSLVFYAIGAAQLSLFVGPQQAVAAGVLPFLVGDALKIVAGMGLMPAAWALCGRYFKSDPK